MSALADLNRAFLGPCVQREASRGRAHERTSTMNGLQQ
jgi:hypothetical protein